MNLFNDVEFYLEDLKSKFTKINPNEYYLSYSGGKDSHFIYWFLREWLKSNDLVMYEKYKAIKIVSVNTYMEHQEILKRMRKYSDIILKPILKPFEIKEKYGSPCFSKEQDFFIDYFQKGSQAPSILKRFYGTEKQSWHNVSKKARDYILSGNAHRISPNCCKYLKKLPFRNFEKETGLKAILGTRGNESVMRKSQYKSCFTKDKKFTPLWDLTDEMIDKIYKQYSIELPSIYQYISRSGCVACVYGNHMKEIEIELALATPNQRKFLCEYFKESYDILGIDYQKFLDEPNKDWVSEIIKDKINN